ADSDSGGDSDGAGGGRGADGHGSSFCASGERLWIPGDQFARQFAPAGGPPLSEVDASGGTYPKDVLRGRAVVRLESPLCPIDLSPSSREPAVESAAPARMPWPTPGSTSR